jgi:hypothetical protein
MKRRTTPPKLIKDIIIIIIIHIISIEQLWPKDSYPPVCVFSSLSVLRLVRGEGSASSSPSRECELDHRLLVVYQSRSYKNDSEYISLFDSSYISDTFCFLRIILFSVALFLPRSSLRPEAI